MKVVLFHVLSSAPEGYWDLKNNPQKISAIRQARSWEISQIKKMENHMQTAYQFMQKTGFSSDDIEIKIQNRKQGVARDIIKEARAGSGLVAAGRRGLTGLPE